MKVELKLNNLVTVAAEGDEMTDVYEQLARLSEIFSCFSKCGVCGGTYLRPIVRDVEGNKFYELQCVSFDKKIDRTCYAKFVLGQHKKPKGSLFPQWHEPVSEEDAKKGVEKKRKPNGGWTRWEGEKK
jgi:hypothetical protein